jgi:hypothetical protein
LSFSACSEHAGVNQPTDKVITEQLSLLSSSAVKKQHRCLKAPANQVLTLLFYSTWQQHFAVQSIRYPEG